MSRRPRIVFPGVQGVAVCNCGGFEFNVGIGIEPGGENRIRVLQCVACGHKLAVPFTSNANDQSEGRRQ